jgi:hypothetical protein
MYQTYIQHITIYLLLNSLPVYYTQLLKFTRMPLGGLGVLQTEQNFTLIQYTAFPDAKKRLILGFNPRVILMLWKNQKRQADLK